MDSSSSASYGDGNSVKNVSFGHDEQTTETKELEFNLANPSQVADILQNISLTDEEEEQLLQEALRINKELKQEMHRREVIEKKQRLGSGKPKLPPITHSKMAATSKAYGFQQSKSSQHRALSMQTKPNSSPPKRKPSSAKSSPATKSGSAPAGPSRSKTMIGARPDWNERFPYQR